MLIQNFNFFSVVEKIMFCNIFGFKLKTNWIGEFFSLTVFKLRKKLEKNNKYKTITDNRLSAFTILS